MTPQEQINQFDKNFKNCLINFFIKTGISDFYSNYIENRARITTDREFFVTPLTTILSLIYATIALVITYNYTYFIITTDFFSKLEAATADYLWSFPLILVLAIISFIGIFIMPFITFKLLSTFVEVITTLYLKGKLSMTIILMILIGILILI